MIPQAEEGQRVGSKSILLDYREGLEQLLSRVPVPVPETLPLNWCGGRILAEPVVADLDLPPFHRAVMDGYALRSSDTAGAPVRLQCIGEVPAGSRFQPALEKGQCVEVMTGASVPPGADAVQMVEKTRRLDSSLVEILEPVSPGENLAPRGSEVASGSVVLESGRWIGPAEAGVLAAFGKTQASVYRAPHAAVVSTGDELVEIQERPGFGQIRNSNAYMLAEQCRRLGITAEIRPSVPDDPERTRRALEEALQADLVLFSGGVSMGRHDYVHQVLKAEGFEIFFHKLSIKPGKPLLVGRKGSHLLFGLPGNPVSAFTTFELFVRPAVRRWMGFPQPGLVRVGARLLARVTQKPCRTYFKPAWTEATSEGLAVEPIETAGSSDLVGFSRANSLLVLAAEVSELEADSQVEVLLLDDFTYKARGS